MHGVKKSSEIQDESRMAKEKEKILHYRTISTNALKLRELFIKDGFTWSEIELNNALSVALSVLEVNSEHYTMWNFRREIIPALLLHIEKRLNSSTEGVKLLENEMLLGQTAIAKNPKVYCVWQHRLWILSLNLLPPLATFQRELKLCAKLLELDDRNFHCWNYRRVVASLSNSSIHNELAFTMSKINSNFSNYSAWHYRSKLLPLLEKDERDITFQKEFENVQHAFFTEPEDQSAWLYHRWLLGRYDRNLTLISSWPTANSSLILEDVGDQIFLIFSHNICENIVISIFLTIGDSVIKNVQCEPFINESSQNVGFRSCNIWTIQFPTTVPMLSEARVSVCIDSASSLTGVDDQHWTGSLVLLEFIILPSDKTSTVCSPSRLVKESVEVDRSILETELHTCHELLAVEPDSKWTNLTVVLLESALRTSESSSSLLNTVRPFLEKLITTDSYRKFYYRHLLSRFVIYSQIETMNMCVVNGYRSACLSGCQLVSLHGMDQLIWAEDLDLSQNDLLTTSGLKYCVRLRKLNLNHNNNLGCFIDISHLCFLEHLSVVETKICCSDLSFLKNLTRLKSVDFRKTPLADDPLYMDVLRKVAPPCLEKVDDYMYKNKF